MKKEAKKDMGKSPVIRPGTGSGSRPMAGKTKTKDSSPTDQHTLGRYGKGAK